MSGAGYAIPIVLVISAISTCTYVVVATIVRRRNLENAHIENLELGNNQVRHFQFSQPGLSKEELDEMFPAKPLHKIIEELTDMKIKSNSASLESAEIVDGHNNINTNSSSHTEDNTTLNNIEKGTIYSEDNQTLTTSDSKEAKVHPYPSTGDIVDEIQIHRIAQEIEENVYEKDCPICQASITSNESEDGTQKKEEVMVRMLSCGHIFHDECISLWLTQRAVCPMCNKSFCTSINHDEARRLSDDLV